MAVNKSDKKPLPERSTAKLWVELSESSPRVGGAVI